MEKIAFFVLLVLVALALTSCVSPYQGQANALTQAYQKGEISSSDYHARINELQALDLQRRMAIQRGFQNLSNNLQQQQLIQQQQSQNNMMLYQINKPRTGFGTIYGPKGSYNYNYYEY